MIKMKKTFFITAGVFVAITIFLNIFVPEPKFKNSKEKLDFAIKSKQFSLAEKLAKSLTYSDSLNIENYVSYINTHFSLPESQGKFS